MQVIDKEEVLELLGDAEQDAKLYDECEAETIKKCIRLIKDIKAVEVVRCKDCEYANCNPVMCTYSCSHISGLRGFVNEGFYYCSYGKRRNDK